jgi:uncharacterized SAM-binding protein YcdF (DUF218 family)
MLENETVTAEALACARIIWNYHQLRHHTIPADIIVALGTNDLRVAGFAADLYHGGFGTMLVCTGGVAHQNDLLATSWEKTEAEMYAEVAVARGVPRERILLEMRATNTGENIRFARELIDRHELRPRNIIVCVKPFMQRRAWATMAVEWPEMPATLASPEMTLDEYFTDELTPDKITNIMMGDLQRIWIYARRGWSAPQRMPDMVRKAYEALVSYGYTQHLIAE